MEAFAAVGLAGSVVQFVDFAAKIVEGVHDLYHSADGTTRRNEELETLARNLLALGESQDLQRLADNTQTSGSKEDVVWYSDAQPQFAEAKVEKKEHIWSTKDASNAKLLQDLSHQCMDIAKQLIELLQTLKVYQTGSHRGWESFRQALKSVWKKATINDLKDRLNSIGDQLQNRIRQKQLDQVTKQLEDLAKQNNRLEAGRANEISQLKKQFNDAFQSVRHEARHGHSQRIWQQLSNFAEQGKELQWEIHVLSTLSFFGMEHRHAAISREHDKTFQWIFSSDQEESNFVQWLENDSNLYWVTGKPGSGKSTLMKFLSSHPKIKEHLKVWAGSSNVVMTSYFFWNAAKDELLKSQTGLLRSILYQILRQTPSLIKTAFPLSWEDSQVDSIPPPSGCNTIEELIDIYKRICDSSNAHDTKFCFFIDGLDEYDGNPSDIIRMVDIIQKNFPHIKLCISSRPWNEFNDRFGVNNPWQLSVNELTKGDIRIYVEDTLGQNKAFRELRETDEQCPDLVQDIVQAADGVFLWVFLVIRSLLEGLTNADRIVDLQGRLKEIPTDLEKYFESILYTVDPRYREQTARTFLVTLDAVGTLPLMCYWYMDESEDHDYALKIPSESVSHMIYQLRTKQMLKRINARSKGLLEATTSTQPERSSHKLQNSVEYRVDFLHRTVRDFLRIATMQQLLQSWSNISYDVDLDICNSILATIRTSPIRILKANASENDLILTMFHHLKQLELDEISSTSQLPLLDALNSCLQGRDLLGLIESKDPLGQYFPDLLLQCMRTGMLQYVERELETRPNLIETHGPILLMKAISPYKTYEKGAEKLDLLQLFLTKGADPNQTDYSTPLLHGSAWQYYLQSLSKAQDKGSQIWTQPTKCHACLELMVEHGASLQSKIRITHRHSNTVRSSESAQDWLLNSQRQANVASSLETLQLKEKHYVKSNKDRAQREKKSTPTVMSQKQIVYTESTDMEMTGQEETTTQEEFMTGLEDYVPKASAVIAQRQASKKKSRPLSGLKSRFKICFTGM